MHALVRAEPRFAASGNALTRLRAHDVLPRRPKRHSVSRTAQVPTLGVIAKVEPRLGVQNTHIDAGNRPGRTRDPLGPGFCALDPLVEAFGERPRLQRVPGLL